ncbi:hypothetical protein APSETT444_005671 [Aspergillus pseudonomiae]
MVLRIVIVGAGLIGPRHAKSVISNPDTELVALIDPIPNAARVAQELQTSYYPTVEAMLQAIPKPDAAIVCTPNHTHVPVSRELLASGIHVLVEKPVSDSIDNGLALLQFAQRPENAHLKLLRPNPPHEAEEGAALTLRFASGVVGTFLVCDATPSPHNFEAGTGENPLIPKCSSGADFYRIFGSDASLSVPDMTRWSYDGRPDKSWNQPLTVEKFDVEEATPFDLQLAHFVDVIQGKAEPSCSDQTVLEGSR